MAYMKKEKSKTDKQELLIGTLPKPYQAIANLSFDLIGREAKNLFSNRSNPIQEVRFERVKTANLMYAAYTISTEGRYPSTSDFDLDSAVTDLDRLENLLESLSSGQ